MLHAIWLIVRKDLTVEVRSREIAYTTLFFAVSCVLVFAFALVKEGRAITDAAAGILWIAIAFAGTLALGRAFERERQYESETGKRAAGTRSRVHQICPASDGCPFGRDRRGLASGI